MKNTAFLILLILIIAGVKDLRGQCQVLLWQDEFESDTLNTEKWNVEFDNSGGGNNELQFYTPRDTNIFVQDGKLVIRALEEEFGNRNYTSAKITTKGIADWRYGRVEAKIRLPRGQGMWPAFWMMPAENIYGGWPASGEIDIMEMVGLAPSSVHGTLHYGPPHNYTGEEYKLEQGIFADTSHVFALEWWADSMKWYVDDELYSFKTRDSLVRPEQWKAFQERFYLILNLAVGGNWPGDPDETTVFPQTMEVDYVRVYGDPTNQEIIAVDSAYALAGDIKYSFNDIPGANFTWTVPESATIIEGQGTNSITVNWDCTPGSVELELSGLDCGNRVFNLPVEFSKPQINGAEEIYILDSAVFDLPELANSTFAWTFPEGTELLNEPDDSAIIKWGCEEDYIKVSIENKCQTIVDSLFVDLVEPKISGPTTVSENSRDVVYAVDNIPESEFAWLVPEDAVITRGQNTDSIFVDFGLEGGTVSVEISNACGSKILSVPIRITDTILLADFENVFLEFETFSSTTFEVSENPETDAVNNSENVGKTFKSEVAWSGIYTDLGYNLDLKKQKKFTMKVLGPKEGTVLFKLEDIDEGNVQPIEVSDEYTNPGSWQELEFIFPDAPSEAFDRVTLFFDFGSEQENIFYFDDIYLLPWNNVSRYPETDNNLFEVYPNPFKDQIIVHLKNIEKAEMTLYDVQGVTVYSGLITNAQKHIRLDGLESGFYILKVDSKHENYRQIVIKK